MRRLLTWIVVTIGIAALVRRLRRRNQQDEAVLGEAEDDPADELRRTLADSRSDDEPPAPAASVGERRSSVHEEGRSTLEEMRGTDTEA